MKLNVVAVCAGLCVLCGSCAHTVVEEQTEEAWQILEDEMKARRLEYARESVKSGKLSVPDSIPAVVLSSRNYRLNKTQGDYALNVLAEDGDADDAALVRPFLASSNMNYRVNATRFFKRQNPSPFELVGQIHVAEFDEENGAETVFKIRNTGDAPQRIAGIRHECACHEFVYSDGEIAPGETVDVRLTIHPFSCVGDVTHRAHVFVAGLYDVMLFAFSYHARPLVSTEVTVNQYWRINGRHADRTEFYANATDIANRAVARTKAELAIAPRDSRITILPPYVVPRVNQNVAEMRLKPKSDDNTKFDIDIIDEHYSGFFELRIPYMLSGAIREKTIVFRDYVWALLPLDITEYNGDYLFGWQHHIELDFVYFCSRADGLRFLYRLAPGFEKTNVWWLGNHFPQDDMRWELPRYAPITVRAWDSYRTVFNLRNNEPINCIVSIRDRNDFHGVNERVIVLEGEDAIVDWFYNGGVIKRAAAETATPR